MGYMIFKPLFYSINL